MDLEIEQLPPPQQTISTVPLAASQAIQQQDENPAVSATAAEPTRSSTQTVAVVTENASTLHTFRFWAILISLGFTGMMSAIEGTILTSALPTITADLGGGDAYIWVPNAFLLSSVAVLPLYAQMSNIFGRRWLLLIAIVVFTLGNGLSGGAKSMTMLIAARTVKGLGGGGINLLIETVLTDIVPLRQRGKYMALVDLGPTVGVSIGPFLGGVLTSKVSWRWCFYINIPVGVLSFIALYTCLRVKYQRSQTWRQQIKRIDFYGNAIFIAAIVSTLIALTWGGTVYEWGGFRILLPLILGFIGLGLFTAFEWTPKLCPEPSVPRKLVSNRTSAAVLVLTFVRSIVAYWGYYFLPIYFQGVLSQTAFRSGVSTLPMFAGVLVFVTVGGLTLSKWGRYKPLHLSGCAVTTLGIGLLTLLDASSSPAAWVCYQLVFAFGIGLVNGVLLPAMQAPLDESLVGTATGLWTFIRYFGAVWGVAIPGAIFNNQCKKLAGTVNDSEISMLLNGGQVYELATKTFLDSISDEALRTQVKDIFAQALRTSWLVALAFAGLAFVVGFIEKEIPLRNTLENEFGIEEKMKQPDPEVGALELNAVQADPGLLPSVAGEERDVERA